MGTTQEMFFELVEPPPALKPTILSIREWSSQVEVDGALYVRGDLRDAENGLGIVGKNIALWIRSPDGVQRVFERRNTGSGGTVEFNTTISSAYYSPGRYFFWLEFAGDEEYEGCEQMPGDLGLGRFQWG